MQEEEIASTDSLKQLVIKTPLPPVKNAQSTPIASSNIDKS